MAHFVIGWLRNTSYYLFGSGSSGLGRHDREREPRGVAGRAALAYLKEGQAMMNIVLIYMLCFLVVVAIVLFL